MKRLAQFIIWTLLLALALFAIDLGFLKLPSDSPGIAPLRHFYLDFRARLVALIVPQELSRPKEIPKSPKDSIAEKIILQEQNHKSEPMSTAADKEEPRYFYVDDKGEIHFVVTLQEIPVIYRGEAKKLER